MVFVQITLPGLPFPNQYHPVMRMTISPHNRSQSRYTATGRGGDTNLTFLPAFKPAWARPLFFGKTIR
jgi:hypothetical protein